jgi:hypothetical protein
MELAAGGLCSSHDLLACVAAAQQLWPPQGQLMHQSQCTAAACAACPSYAAPQQALLPINTLLRQAVHGALLLYYTLQHIVHGMAVMVLVVLVYRSLRGAVDVEELLGHVSLGVGHHVLEAGRVASL